MTRHLWWPELDLFRIWVSWNFQIALNLEFILKLKEFESGSNEFFVARRVSCRRRQRHQAEFDLSYRGNPICNSHWAGFWHSQHGSLNHNIIQIIRRYLWATLMLVTDVEDEMCWRQLWDAWLFLSPTSSIFGHKCRAPTTKRFHQYRNSVTNIHKLSLR